MSFPMYLCSYAMNVIIVVFVDEVVEFVVLDVVVVVESVFIGVCVDVFVVFVLITECWSTTTTYGFCWIVSVSLNNTIYPLLS